MILPSSKHTTFFSATCLAIGFMVSPLSMPVVGNGASVLGYGLLWVLPVAALLNFFTVNRYFTSLKRDIFCRCGGKNEGQGI